MTYYYVVRSCGGFVMLATCSEFEARNAGWNCVDHCFVTTNATEMG